MKTLFVFLTIWIIQITNGVDLNKVRNMYHEAGNNKKVSEQFYLTMGKMNVDKSPVLLAYKGVATMMQANNTINPYSKFTYFSDGKKLLEQAVKLEQNNIEIRFIRFCTQYNTPSFLGYRDELLVDKSLILQSWKGMANIDLKEKIKNYMLQTDVCTNEEKQLFR